ncbi:hypothetical protein EOD42_04835 [Rhodovarius crocodyli]|uniref:Uncharacterized protein n=1 Tax=Rhodovarius crocodyli TaxID=1979269 RepID=A0A437MP41_9PROT|nr:hypothetical protein [Rhodovarius crocodyli]RVT99417.1 hypothetical protein EOD42_04835 [Rhodovarius crocodyli]
MARAMVTKMGVLAGLGLLTACGNPQTTGIVAIGPDTFAVETRGRDLSTAVERGLTEATSFCAAQSKQTELLGTRINPSNYQVAFRCTGAGFANNPSGGVLGRVPAGYAGRQAPAGYATRQSALGSVPVSNPLPGGYSNAPVLSGQAFRQAPPPPGPLDLGTVGSVPARTANVPGNPFAAPAAAPAAGGLNLPPASSILGGGAPVAAAPAVPAGFQPLSSPLASAPAAPAYQAPRFAPAPSAAPLPPMPAAGGASVPSGGFAPLTSPPPGAAAPAAAPSGFQPLPGARSALQPVASPNRGAASVPAAPTGFQPLPPPPVLQ